MIGGLSYLDLGLLAIVAISGLVAMYRGLTREILSIMSWVAAAAACVFFVFKFKAEAQQVAEQFHAPLLVAQVGIGGIIFLVVLIIVHLITSRISDSVLDSRIGAIDRILGLAFGIVRGFVLVSQNLRGYLCPTQVSLCQRGSLYFCVYYWATVIETLYGRDDDAG